MSAIGLLKELLIVAILSMSYIMSIVVAAYSTVFGILLLIESYFGAAALMVLIVIISAKLLNYVEKQLS